MAQFSSDTKIRGDLNVESEITQSDLKYNVSKITNNEEQIIGDDKIDTSLNVIGTSLPSSSNAVEGQIYFKIIN